MTMTLHEMNYKPDRLSNLNFKYMLDITDNDEGKNYWVVDTHDITIISMILQKLKELQKISDDTNISKYELQFAIKTILTMAGKYLEDEYEQLTIEELLTHD